MSDRDDNGPLLADVLAEPEDAGFREAVLEVTLRQVRRRRRFRRSRPFVAAVAMAGAVALIVAHFLPPRTPAVRPEAKGYELVTTRTLPPSAIVHTQPFDRERSIVSASTVPIVHTPLGGNGIRLLNDRELLALAGEAHPAVLIRIGPHEQRLVFAKNQDQNGFLLP